VEEDEKKDEEDVVVVGGGVDDTNTNRGEVGSCEYRTLMLVGAGAGGMGAERSRGELMSPLIVMECLSRCRRLSSVRLHYLFIIVRQ